MTGVADMSGVAGGFQAIVADVLGIAPDLVQVQTLDSDSAPASPGSGGSTITYSAGRAIRRAAEETGQRLLEAAALQLEIAVEDLELVDGTVRPRGTPERAIPIAKVVRGNARAGPGADRGPRPGRRAEPRAVGRRARRAASASTATPELSRCSRTMSSRTSGGC